MSIAEEREARAAEAAAEAAERTFVLWVVDEWRRDAGHEGGKGGEAA